VNIMLSMIGEQPVNTLDTGARGDVSRAKLALAEKTKSIQSSGWWFNREEDYPFIPNVNGEYVIPANTLSVTAPTATLSKFVERGKKLYNKETHLFTGHTSTIEMDIVVGLAFEDLPEEARRYIFISAARVFGDRTVSDPGLHQWSTQDEAIARADLITRELAESRHTAFSSTSVYDIVKDRLY